MGHIQSAMASNQWSMQDLARKIGVATSTLTRSMASQAFTKRLAAQLSESLGPPPAKADDMGLQEVLRLLHEARRVIAAAEALTGNLLDPSSDKR